MKKQKVTPKKVAAIKKARVRTPVVKKVAALVEQRTLHLVLAPQDPEGLMEFKSKDLLNGLDFHEWDHLYLAVHQDEEQEQHHAADLCTMVVITNTNQFKLAAMARTTDSPVEHAQIAATEFSDENNLLTISRMLFSDKSVKTELSFGAIPVEMICPDQPSFSRGLRDLRRMKVKPIKPARAWHRTGIKPANPRYREHRETA